MIDPGLLEVRSPGPNSAILPSLAPQFQAKHEANLEVARQGDAALLLIGDSITDFWRNAEGPFAGKPVLDRYFGHWTALREVLAGARIEHINLRAVDPQLGDFACSDRASGIERDDELRPQRRVIEVAHELIELGAKVRR